MTNKIHEGRNVKRFREVLGIKQEVLAAELGEDWTQKKISLLEQKESIEADILQQVAQILKVPEAVIRNFDENAMVSVFSNSFSDCFSDCPSSSNGIISNSTISFDIHPEDRLVTEFKHLVDEIKRLNEMVIKEKEEKAALYERLLEEMKNRR